MGVYVVTGGSSGMGARAVAALQAKGHTTVNVDIKGGDINANLGTGEGRQHVIDEVHARYPEGIDGLICCAGVMVTERISPAACIAINYFGTVEVCEGLFDSLEKKKGACVITSSGRMMDYKRGNHDVSELLNDDGNEERILRLVNSLDPKIMATSVYGASKFAVARWMRRASGTWATHGLRINCICPGVTATPMTATMPPEIFDMFCLSMPVTTTYKDHQLMDAQDLGNAFVYLVSPEARGFNGCVIFCDGGTEAFLGTEKVY